MKEKKPLQDVTFRLIRLGASVLPLAVLLVTSVHAQPAKPGIGLALSGGSALGLAHVGVIQWLEEHRIPITHIGGTSMGGLVSGIYASGMDSAEMVAFVKTIDWSQAFQPSAPFHELSFRRKEDRRGFPNKLEFGLKGGKFRLPSGLFSGHEVGLILSRFAAPYSDMASFDDLPTPFRCVSMDLIQGKQVIFSSGSMVDALRSTMSLPGVFSPFELGDKMMVDGATLNNLPVDVVKEMAPGPMIAVPLIDPPAKKESLDSLLSVAGRSLSVMIDANAKRTREIADLLVTPDMTGLTGGDFDKFEEFEKRGYAAAEANKQALLKYAVSEEEYKAYQAERQKKRRSTATTPTFVDVSGVSAAEDEKITQRLTAKFAGHPFKSEQLDATLTEMTGEGPYQSANYSFVHRNGADGLNVNVQPKPYGPPFIDTGISLDASETNNIRFGVGGRITFVNKGLPNSEWRTDFTLGLNNSVASEYYWFLGKSKWFAAPHSSYSRRQEDVYQGNQKTSQVAFRDIDAGSDFGYAAGRFSEFRLGYDYDHYSDEVTAGNTVQELTSRNFNAAHLRFAHDSQDSSVVPRRGIHAVSDFRWNFSIGGGSQYGIAQQTFTFAKAFGPRYVLLPILSGGTILGPRSVFPPFSVGGALSLTALGRGQLRGDQFYNANLYGLRAFSAKRTSFMNRVFLALGYESGMALAEGDSAKPAQDGVLAVVAETPIGVAFVGYSIGSYGNHKFVVRIGRLF